jgi:hypothetical protein
MSIGLILIILLVIKEAFHCGKRATDRVLGRS